VGGGVFLGFGVRRVGRKERNVWGSIRGGESLRRRESFRRLRKGPPLLANHQLKPKFARKTLFIGNEEKRCQRALGKRRGNIGGGGRGHHVRVVSDEKR